MRLPVLVGVCLSLVAMSLAAKASEFSHSRDLPPLKLAATDLDTILHKTHSLIAAANGPPGGQEFIRESVKLGVGGHEIEIPHFSLASSVAFPKEVFRFAYTHYRPDKPISSVTLDFSDYSRRVSVRGGSANQVETISDVLVNDLLHYSSPIGGRQFRRLAGGCLSMLFLTSLMIGSAYCWKTQNYSALGIPICSGIGLLLVLFLPWNRLLPGFAVYQRYSPFFVIRHLPEICLLGLFATLAGIPVSYFLPRWRRKTLAS